MAISTIAGTDPLTALRNELLELMSLEMGAHSGGDEKHESDEQKAQRLVSEELRKRGWTEQDLATRRKTDAIKVKMAARLRRETVMTLDWIAQRLHGMPAHRGQLFESIVIFYNSRD